MKLLATVRPLKLEDLTEQRLADQAFVQAGADEPGDWIRTAPDRPAVTDPPRAGATGAEDAGVARALLESASALPDGALPRGRVAPRASAAAALAGVPAAPGCGYRFLLDIVPSAWEDLPIQVLWALGFAGLGILTGAAVAGAQTRDRSHLGVARGGRPSPPGRHTCSDRARSSPALIGLNLRTPAR